MGLISLTIVLNFLVEVERPADKQGNREKTVGFKLPDGTIRVTDKGFDYNVGRLNYKPNLDLYPEKTGACVCEG